MDRGMYLAMSGAHQLTVKQRVTNNNLANASTTGFKADMAAALSRPVHGDFYGSRVYGQAVQAVGSDITSGSLQITGRSLDVAVMGEQAWMAVQGPDGNVAYSRRGDLRVSPNGLLEDGAGRQVMGNGGPVALPPFDSLEIGSDGTITIVPEGQNPNATAVLDRILLASSQGVEMRKGEDGLFRPLDGQVLPADANVQLASGTLEQSNVNAVHELVNLIEIQRQFEMQINMMTTMDEAAEQTSSLLRIE
jgi:flagellar basal-body rod protein FlgF